MNIPTENKQALWLLSVAAGCNRTDTDMERKVMNLFSYLPHRPFDTVKMFAYEKPGGLEERLSANGVSPAGKIGKLFYSSACNPELNLDVIDPAFYERFQGISPYIARLYIHQINPQTTHILLIPEILKFLGDNGVEKVPVTTPTTSKAYNRLEQEFLRLCEEHSKAPAVLQRMVEEHNK